VNAPLIGLVVVLVLILLILPRAIRIVREYQRLLVFRLGRSIGTKGPGLVIVAWPMSLPCPVLELTNCQR
jgi:regulator of protease activity HflC (stomatin/prohibitin superfamily)